MVKITKMSQSELEPEDLLAKKGNLWKSGKTWCFSFPVAAPNVGVAHIEISDWKIVSSIWLGSRCWNTVRQPIYRTHFEQGEPKNQFYMELWGPYKWPNLTGVISPCFLGVISPQLQLVTLGPPCSEDPCWWAIFFEVRRLKKQIRQKRLPTKLHPRCYPLIILS